MKDFNVGAILNRLINLRDSGTAENELVSALFREEPFVKGLQEGIKYGGGVAGAPVMAALASKVLTVGEVPSEGDTVSIGGVVYKFRLTALGAGDFATGKFTTLKAPAANAVVVIDGVSYKFVTALSTPAVPNEVKIGDQATSLSNLIAAIMGTAGAGEVYSVGTVSLKSKLTATVTETSKLLITAVKRGYLANAITTTGTADYGSWEADTLTGGIDPQAPYDVFVNGTAQAAIVNLEKALNLTGTAGTDYGVGTVKHALATMSAKTASTATIAARLKGALGNLIALATEMTDEASVFDNEGETRLFLRGGVDGTVALAGARMFEATKDWIAVTACTVSDSSGWKYKALT